MIIVLVGNIGTGKTVALMRQIIIRGNAFKTALTRGATKLPYKAIVNFNTLNIPYAQRIRATDIIKERVIETTMPNGKVTYKTKHVVNWEYWEDLRDNYHFDVFLDELNTTINSRDAMSITNKLFSKWLFQIRKILGSSELNNIYIVTQHINQIDINFVRMAHIIMECKKIPVNDEIIISLKHYADENAYQCGESYATKVFFADSYFKFYDSYRLVKFGDDEEYI